MDPRTQFCPNMDCPAGGRVGKGNIRVHSRQEPRYQCVVCRKTIAATKGTPFRRLHHELDLMTIVVTLLAHRCPRQAIVMAYDLDERIVGDCQERSGGHCQQVHEALVQQPRDLEHVQADELRVKAQRQVLWMALALMVRTRLWLGGVIGACRDEDLIVRLITLVRSSALARPLLFCVDGFASYVRAIRAAFRTPVPQGTRGRPRLVAWPDILVA